MLYSKKKLIHRTRTQSTQKNIKNKITYILEGNQSRKIQNKSIALEPNQGFWKGKEGFLSVLEGLGEFWRV